jgi:hypothetical protein
MNPIVCIITEILIFIALVVLYIQFLTENPSTHVATRGMDGINGTDGARGLPGLTGHMGPPSQKGSQGQQGPRGITGTVNLLSWTDMIADNLQTGDVLHCHRIGDMVTLTWKDIQLKVVDEKKDATVPNIKRFRLPLKYRPYTTSQFAEARRMEGDYYPYVIGYEVGLGTFRLIIPSENTNRGWNTVTRVSGSTTYRGAAY